MLEQRLDRFFTETAPLEWGDRLLVAFSGGPDSTALLSAAARLGARRGFSLVAAHLDHGLDTDSSRRARRATALARSIGVPLELETVRPTVGDLPDRGPEDWARRVRYDFLERTRRAVGARYVATAHHRDDQIETVLLRLLMGSGLEGLGSIEPHRGHIVRPLLDSGRREIAAELQRSGLRPSADPTNQDPRRPRNQVRQHLMPYLEGLCGDLGGRTVAIAAEARRISSRLEHLLAAHLGLASHLGPASHLELEAASRPASLHGSVSYDLERFRGLPGALRPFALSLLHRSVGSACPAASHYPAGGAARRELERQLQSGGAIGCDCGDGWRWESRPGAEPSSGRLVLRRQHRASMPPFAYTLAVPGEVAIPELKLCVSIAREPVTAWVFEGHPSRAALDLPIVVGDRLVVRNRQPGDRLRPLGCGYQRRLKEILIDAGVPHEQRDRLPLLCLENQIAWVPGLTIDESYRIKDQEHAWIARIEPMESSDRGECSPDETCSRR